MATAGVELDKLKRRMIRTVARLLKEKKTQNEVWEVLRHESGSNCKKLWERMRSLTLKKLRRLQEAEDRVTSIPSFAQMSLTDWLMYDLVIVHEDMDPIEEEILMSSQVLTKLFSLVQMHNIEGLVGDALTEAWTTATLNYNSNGYQCSPMLMQRRWFQLKKASRDRFYKFWFVHRGNPRLLSMASSGAPTKLQQAVALRYPEIITKVFLDWEERIEKRLIIMPNEFEDRLRNRQGISATKPQDIGPDILILEPQIDTISVGDSDEECEPEGNKDDKLNEIPETSDNESEENKKSEQNGISEETQIPIIVNVKSEPQDDSNIPTSEVRRVRDFREEIEMIQNEEQKLIDDEMKCDDTETLEANPNNAVPGSTIKSDTTVANNAETVVTDKEDTDKEVEDVCAQSQDAIMIDSDDEDMIMPQTVEASYQNNVNTNDQNHPISVIEDSDDNQPKCDTDDLQKVNDIVKAEELFSKQNEKVAASVNAVSNQEDVLPIIASIACGEQAIIKTECNIQSVDDRMSEDEEDIITLDNGPILDANNQPRASADIDVPSDIHLGDGLEFADDGIEYVEEENEDTSEFQECDDVKPESQTSPKFDLKLLMQPVVYTTKLDHMNVCSNIPLYETIQQKELIESIILESKPISTKSINVDTVKDLPPDNEDDFQDDDLHQGDLVRLEPNLHQSDDLDVEVMVETARVKISSHLLQKPRSRSYNPIQLCKNPDFNTRLKRLNVGFFSYSTNRGYLKVCKPMTIDVSKAFESKLVHGTMYLKENDDVVDVNHVQHIHNSNKHNSEASVSASTIMPSAVAVQSLMNSTNVDQILQEELKKRMLERNKVINLPSISVVRQINDQLQKAAVAPIMALVKNKDIDGVHSLKVQNQDKEAVEALENLKLGTIIENATATFHKHGISGSEILHHNKDIQSIDSSIEAINKPITTLENDKISTDIKQAENKDTTDVIGTIEPINKAQSEDKKGVAKKKNKRKLPPWFQAKAYSQTDYDACYNDTLLTIDSLYKMLISLDPKCIQRVNNAKNQLKEAEYTNLKYMKSKKSKNCSVDSIKKTVSVVELINNNEELNKSAKDPTKIKRSNVTDTIDDRQESTKFKRRLNKKINQQCCWCKYQLDKLMGYAKKIPKHRCELNNCNCCCADKLKIYVQMKRAIISINTKISPAELNKAIENVVLANNEVDTIELDDNEMVGPHVTKVTAPVTKIRVNVNLVPEVPPSVTADNNDTPQYSETNSDSTNHHQVCDNMAEGHSPPEKIRTRIFPGDRFRSDNNENALKDDQQQRLSLLRPRVATVPNLEESSSCSCRPNVSVDQQQGTLLIDGSNECTVHKRIRTKQLASKEAKIYINKKSVLTDTPYYLGKNKILVTNLKRPTPPVTTDPSLVLMPDGVNIVVLPDGTITCQLQNPNVILTPEQLASLPFILNAIKEEINAVGITLPVLQTEGLENNNQNAEISNVNESQTNASNVDEHQIKNAPVENTYTPSDPVIDITADDTKSPNVAEYVLSKSGVVTDIDEPNDNIQRNKTDELPPDILPNISEIHTECVVKDKSQTESNEAVISNVPITVSCKVLSPDESIVNADIAMEEKSEVPVVQIPNENLETVDKNRESVTEMNITNDTNSDLNAAGTSTSRNLLSDLMEMSGILEEDGSTTAEEPAIRVPNKPIVHESVSEPAAPVANFPLIPPLGTPTTSNQSNVADKEDVSRHGLFTVTCFADLRYASDNGGLFFKLDVNTGEMTPINVCIQMKNNLAVVSQSTEVIDLTTEQGESDSPVQNDTNKKNMIILGPRAQGVDESPNVAKSTSLSNNLKPMKMLQSLQQRSNHMMRRILDRRKTLLIKSRQTLKRSYNKFSHIDARVNLIDSDTPMEEEYLDESEESSDDEPLAKVARKMRGTERRDCEGNMDEEDEDMEVEMIDFEAVLDNNVPTSPPTSPVSASPIPTKLVRSSTQVSSMGPPIIINSLLAAQEADDDDSQEDCILGF